MERISRTPKQIGETVRFQHRKMKLTQSQVSEKTRLRQGTISMVEAETLERNFEHFVMLLRPLIWSL